MPNRLRFDERELEAAMLVNFFNLFNRNRLLVHKSVDGSGKQYQVKTKQQPKHDSPVKKAQESEKQNQLQIETPEKKDVSNSVNCNQNSADIIRDNDNNS